MAFSPASLRLVLDSRLDKQGRKAVMYILCFTILHELCLSKACDASTVSDLPICLEQRNNAMFPDGQPIFFRRCGRRHSR